MPNLSRQKYGGKPRLLDHDLIHELKRQGYSGPAIAKKLGCTRATVNRIIKKSDPSYVNIWGQIDFDLLLSLDIDDLEKNSEPPVSNKKYNDFTPARLYQRGRTTKEIANLLLIDEIQVIISLRRVIAGVGTREFSHMPGLFRCSTCKEYLPSTDFHLHNTRKTGLCGICKKCRKASRPPLEVSREYDRKYRLPKKYGITVEEYEKAINSQGGNCGICNRPCDTKNKKGRLSVDHDHITGKFRGLLCVQCNVGLGSFDDSSEILRQAALYLEKHSSPSEVPHA